MLSMMDQPRNLSASITIMGANPAAKLTLGVERALEAKREARGQGSGGPAAGGKQQVKGPPQASRRLQSAATSARVGQGRWGESR